MTKAKHDLPEVIVYGDGVRDDTDALEKIVNGEARGVHTDGLPFPQPGEYKTTRTIKVKRQSN